MNISFKILFHWSAGCRFQPVFLCDTIYVTRTFFNSTQRPVKYWITIFLLVQKKGRVQVGCIRRMTIRMVELAPTWVRKKIWLLALCCTTTSVDLSFPLYTCRKRIPFGLRWTLIQRIDSVAEQVQSIAMVTVAIYTEPEASRVGGHNNNKKHFFSHSSSRRFLNRLTLINRPNIWWC